MTPELPPDLEQVGDAYLEVDRWRVIHRTTGRTLGHIVYDPGHPGTGVRWGYRVAGRVGVYATRQLAAADLVDRYWGPAWPDVETVEGL